jgi:indolepyruvate ferredoxin oxidoreductase
MPVFNPATVQDYLDYGLYGFAMSRYSGCWIGFKAITDTVESSASVSVDPQRLEIVTPEDFEMPDGGVHIRWPDAPIAQEDRQFHHKLKAAEAFARANGLDRTVIEAPRGRLGIVTTGKAYLDVRQALDELGIDDARARDLGISIYKVAMPWPLEPEGARRFAQAHEEILVVEEKRALIEDQLAKLLYSLEGPRPRLLGKSDESGAPLVDDRGELTPPDVARAIGSRLLRAVTDAELEARVNELPPPLSVQPWGAGSQTQSLTRLPYYCSGCPHNTSTNVPEGSFAQAGIGCHSMAMWMPERRTIFFSHMGGEGVTWIGQAPFTELNHMFQNLGDGTYYHSGLMAIRAAVAAGVNITYKILFNDAVAMTGGQPVEGQLTVPEITRQVHAEGVSRIMVVSDEPDKYPMGSNFATGVTFHHRDDLDRLQRELREVPGATVLVYDQTCAAEKRRRRKRNQFPDPPRRIFINEAVCEGCGDCSVVANCVSLEPVETELGRKRRINQSSCNKDYSCLKGFCPSFVTVHDGAVRKLPKAATGADAAEDPFADLPPPQPAAASEPYSMLVTGIGGTGVVTIGALLGMAAHIEGKGCSVLDVAGLAQKNGAVTSHIRIADNPDDLNAVRIASRGADLLLGCDIVVAAGPDAQPKIASGKTHAVINSHVVPTAAFQTNPDLDLSVQGMQRIIRESAGDNLTDFVDASGTATALMGDAISTNMFMLGYAVQRGLVPVSVEALERAIEINGVAVENNKKTLSWGRLAAHDPGKVEDAARPLMEALEVPEVARTLEEIVDIRVKHLTDYQDAAYAKRYADLVKHVEAAEREKARGMTGLAEAVARYLFKLMAYKDEYEVARLYTSGDFQRRLNAQFDGDFKLSFHLAPPLIAPRDPETGELKKMKFGPWVFSVFKVLAKLKGLRGTRWDIFGRTAERRRERELIVEYETTVGELVAKLGSQNHALAVEIAQIPEHIRGFGHVKEAKIAEAKAREADLLAAFRSPSPQVDAAE